MKITFRKFKYGDFIKIRDFLVDTYKLFDKPYNDSIGAWNFSRSLSRIMNSVSIEMWEDKIGIWKNEKGDFVAVVISGGEGKGLACFESGMVNLPSDILEEMFEFSEKNISIENDGKQVLYLSIFDKDESREAIAKNRGYKKIDYVYIQEMPIENRQDVRLPDGFSIKSGDEVSDKEKSLAHAKAFGYYDEEHYTRLSLQGYESLRQMPDYRPDLDIYIVSESNEIAAFCTIWYDDVNKIGLLEPVGTHPEYRKMGLGRAVIGKTLEKIANKGALKAHVVSNKEFYVAIGFEKKYKVNVWQKIIE